MARLQLCTSKLLLDKALRREQEGDVKVTQHSSAAEAEQSPRDPQWMNLQCLWRFVVDSGVGGEFCVQNWWQLQTSLSQEFSPRHVETGVREFRKGCVAMNTIQGGLIMLWATPLESEIQSFQEPVTHENVRTITLSHLTAPFSPVHCFQHKVKNIRNKGCV